jgi:2-hydroxychromene-2-carboxylate isomerase
MDSTQAAVDRDVFGIPSFFVGDDLYFGKDTLWEIAERVG